MTMVKIEQIELLLLELPYVHFFETSFGREQGRTFILVKVYADGICGYGEVVADKAPLYSYETTSTAWLMLKDYFIPLIKANAVHDPLNFSRLAGKYKGHPMAKAGMELALWDLEGKRKQQPLWKIYGGTKQEILSGVSVGIQDTMDELIRRIEEFLSEGYGRIKIKIKPGWDVDVCRKLRQEFPDILLQADANGGYTIANIDILKNLDEFGLQMLEQPFPAYDLWDHSRLQKEMKTPICLDESAVSADSVRKALEMGSCRIINIKVGRVGGVHEAIKIHDLCCGRGIPVWCGGMLESGIGRAHNLHLATLPNFKLHNDLSASKRYYKEDLIDPAIDITPQGTIIVPNDPGIGVNPVEDRIRKASLKREVFKF